MKLESKLVQEGDLYLKSEEIIADYRLCYKSRQASLIGRREVLTGKAKFGIFGDGKELAQVAMAKVFQPGDIRSGYYRDQTFAFASGISTIKQFFAQLYANINLEAEPSSGGRQMNAHLGTRMLHPDGSWKNLTEIPISSSDISCTGSQMPRLVGLGQASTLYRNLPELSHLTSFSNHGKEIAFGTIGNGSCAEGLFWESVNAIGVIQAPVILSIWDDGYGISVPNKYQITKSDLSTLLSGFQKEEDTNGFEIFTVQGWDYVTLRQVYREAARIARNYHTPSIIHVTELTQPQGHSTSGSHERYKSRDRLEWESSMDCLQKMRDWILTEGMATEEELEAWEKEDRKLVRKIKNDAWNEVQAPIKEELNTFVGLALKVASQSAYKVEIRKVIESVKRNTEPSRRDYMEAAHKILLLTFGEAHTKPIQELKTWRDNKNSVYDKKYDSFLLRETEDSVLNVPVISPIYSDDSPKKNGFEIINLFFDEVFQEDPRIIAFGEDVGFLGDVNQGFAGLQQKYGDLRISDTGIREATILGQAIGLAMRGLRPIAEIQYLDYLLYALQIMSDDLATLSYRTVGGQKAPAIIRTRGHRLEGIWHSGSPLGMIIHALRGMCVCVPRNMVQAAGMYKTLLGGSDPGLVIEVLNGYRLKERLPENIGQYTVPLGVPEIIRKGSDITLITYGACCRIALEAAEQLEQVGIDVEIIDVQTLLPFDLHRVILSSLKKTNRIIFMDEDVPGGATSYMMQQVLEEQGGYAYLDSSPITITSKAHRTPYGNDGDYWTKPQAENVFNVAYEIMNEAEPTNFPAFF